MFLDRSDINTDEIIPAKYLTEIEKTAMKPHLLEDLKLDVEQGKPELPFIIDRQKARRLNVSTGQIGDAIRTSLYGKEVSTFKDGANPQRVLAFMENKTVWHPIGV